VGTKQDETLVHPAGFVTYDASERTVAEPEPDSVKLRPRRLLRFVGVAGIIFAALGLWYNGTTVFAEFSPGPSEPYFSSAFYAMSAICVVCYGILIYVGIQFARLKTSALSLFVGLMVFEVAYFFAVGAFWTAPGLGSSIAAASGVANGGLVFQLLILFPLWGPLLARWAKNRIELRPSEAVAGYWPKEQVVRPGDWAWTAANFVLMFFLTSVLIGLAWRLVSPGTMPPGYMTLCIPALVGVAGCIARVRLRRRRRREEIDRRRAGRLRAGLCPRCEYNLTGNVSGRCPECGERISA